MAATLDVSVIAELQGLGQDISFLDKGTDGTTPTATTGRQYRTLATADADEVLDLGDVSTVTCIIIRAVTLNLDIDLDYTSSFSADMTVKAGEIPAVIVNPVGVTRVKNNGAGETPVFEVWVIGTT
ncbi:hypothetical protein LCGC14_1207160 [marine sediment metagenome]|uniref:Uncharacterized protein n=1 Tax=marine sediment metagenome TaxID=412755 RepID=A0A0F9PJS9_9ZZZZ